MLNNLLVVGLLGVVVSKAIISIPSVLKRKKKVADREQFERELQEKVARRQQEFEEFKKYIEGCPQPEDIEIAENLDITFDWSNLSLISRLTIDDVVINVNDKLLQHGCRVDYRNIAYHTLRNPLPTFN